MKVPGISFTISTLLVRAAQSIRAHFDAKRSQGRENWDTARWLTVTGWLFQLSPNQELTYIKWIITVRIQNVKTLVLVNRGAGTEHVQGEK